MSAIDFPNFLLENTIFIYNLKYGKILQSEKEIQITRVIIKVVQILSVISIYSFRSRRGLDRFWCPDVPVNDLLYGLIWDLQPSLVWHVYLSSGHAPVFWRLTWLISLQQMSQTKMGWDWKNDKIEGFIGNYKFNYH